MIQAILEPALMRLNMIIQKRTSDRISLYTNTETLGLSFSDIVVILDALADDLVLFYHDYREEMMILMLHSEAHTRLEEWLSQLIQVVTLERFDIKQEMKDFISNLSRTIAVSIFSGMQECFLLADKGKVKDSEIRQLIRVYFRSCVNMMNIDNTMMEGAAA